MKRKLLNILLVGVLMLSTLLAGCGSGEEEKKGVQAGQKGPWYKAEYFDMQLDENEYMHVMQAYGDYFYFVNGKWSEDTGTNSFTFEKMHIKDHTITELPFNMEKNSYPVDMFVNDNGIYLACQLMEYNDDYSKLLNAQYLIKHLDLEGNEIAVFDLSENISAKASEEHQAYMSSIAMDKDGNLYVSDNSSYILVYDKDGNLLADIEKEGWGNGLIAGTDGTVYYSYMEEASWEEVIVEVDVEKAALGEKIGNMPNNSNTSNLTINENKQFYATVDNTLKLIDLTAEENTDILYWLDYDINGNDVRFVTELEDGTIFAYCESYGSDEITCELVTIVESDEPIEEKTVLTYATFGLDSEITDAIIRFNKNNDTYRIKVVDYYNDEDYATGLDAYNEAILNGEAADILSVSLETYKSYARKGLYVDLNELLNADADIKREDYFENVLQACEVDGKLYTIPISFSVSTLAGRTSIWGEDTKLTTEAVAEMMKRAGDDAELIEYMTKDQWLWVALQASMDNYIDWETGQCYFDSEEFIAVLELANQFPMENNWQEGALSTPRKLQAGKLLLSSENYSEITGLQVTKAIFGEDITFVGYPDAGGNGALISSYRNNVAISADSDYREGAWEFVKYLISEEYQSNYIRWDNPIHKGAFEEQMADATKIETYINENGEEVESPQMTYGWEDFEVSVYHATQEDVDDYRELLEGATTIMSYEEDIMAIINEEVAPFFEGQKTAQEVAGIIQGRINIYVNENR